MDNINLNFVSQAGSSLASHRMRVLKPVELFNVGVNGIKATINATPNPEADVNIFNKHFHPDKNLHAVLNAKTLGYQTMFDVCDDHFDRSFGEYYEKMCQSVDHITCNSSNMQERIYDVVGRTARIIPDPMTSVYRCPLQGQPLVNRFGSFPSFLWHGHSSNALPLLDWLDHVPGPVTAVCNAGINHPKVEYKPWSPFVLENIIHLYDFILIPTTKEPWAKCKSPNRAVDGINSGKIVITDSRDIYGDLEEFLYIIDDPKEIPDIVKAVQADPEEAVRKVLAGQEFVQDKFSDSVILDGWLTALKEIDIVKEFKQI